MYPQGEPAGSTFQGFIKLLRRWTDRFVTILAQTLRERTAAELPAAMKIAGYLLFGVDGSRIEVARTLTNEAEFLRRRKGGRKRGRKSGKNSRHRPYAKAADQRKSQSPSMWITTLWHMGTGLPWDWRLGPSGSSERAHWLEMLTSLMQASLIVGDAGFVGYHYASTVMSAGHDVMIRVGSNVKLLKQLGYAREKNGLVYLWPDAAAKRKLPPLTFRLVVAGNGKHPVYLITSVLSPNKLSDRQVLDVYKRRWGVELFYRHLKQTFGKRKLKSTSPESAYVEMHWSLLGLWCMALYGLKELQKSGVSLIRMSFAKLLRAFRRIIRDYAHPVQRGASLCDLLGEAIIDNYKRGPRTSRDYPRKKEDKPPGAPRIKTATHQQKAQAKKLKNAA